MLARLSRLCARRGGITATAACLAVALTLYVAPALAQEGRLPRALDASETITYYIAPGEDGSTFRNTDRELAAWALADWQRASGGALKLTPTADEGSAVVRVYWVPADGAGQYGEMRATLVGDKRGAAVFIRPDTDALGPEIGRLARADDLFRDTIVYLTCLHELGHALGLEHTANFDDIMYFFGFGGDIPAFFGRYREQLRKRSDIANLSGLSAGDLAHLHALYGQ
jgi:hypothetical protein